MWSQKDCSDLCWRILEVGKNPEDQIDVWGQMPEDTLGPWLLMPATVPCKPAAQHKPPQISAQNPLISSDLPSGKTSGDLVSAMPEGCREGQTVCETIR